MDMFASGVRLPAQQATGLDGLKCGFSHSPWIYTMLRCAPLAVLATALALALPAAAQMQRQFPRNALRGEMLFTAPPEVVLNGQPARLAPGARIRGENNMLMLQGHLVGGKAIVHFTTEGNGLVKDVWILSADELAVKPWPRTLQEAETWEYDPAARTWSKP
jgi:hypothetical protein